MGAGHDASRELRRALIFGPALPAVETTTERGAYLRLSAVLAAAPSAAAGAARAIGAARGAIAAARTTAADAAAARAIVAAPRYTWMTLSTCSHPNNCA